MKIIFILLVMATPLIGCDILDVDKCLDRGGRWDYEKKTCDL